MLKLKQISLVTPVQQLFPSYPVEERKSGGFGGAEALQTLSEPFFFSNYDKSDQNILAMPLILDVLVYIN